MWYISFYVDAKNPRALFVKLTLQMNKVNNNNLKQDLVPLFENRAYIENWLKNWLERLKDMRINDRLTIFRSFCWWQALLPKGFRC